MNIKPILKTILYFLLSYIWVSSAFATGMQPDVTAVLVSESIGEATISVKNTDRTPALLYISLENLPEESQPTPLIITPPVARVEPGETQLVRFILDDSIPLQPIEQLRRVIFEGIPFLESSKESSPLRITIRQNLPVVIRPKELAYQAKPWEQLVWSLNSKRQLEVNNPSPYVVRLSHQVQLNPTKHIGFLPNPYILPGQSVVVLKLPKFSRAAAAAIQSVCFEPVSAYGQAVKAVQVPVYKKV